LNREESWDDDDDNDNDDKALNLAYSLKKTTQPLQNHFEQPLARLSRSIPAASPRSSVFSVPTTIHLQHIVIPLALCFSPIHKERCRLGKKSRPKTQGVFELAHIPPSRDALFSDVDLPRPALPLRMKKAGTSDLSSVEEGAPLILQFSVQTVLFLFHLGSCST
jgi:hypothetical protein